ncbi:MAG: cell division protein FtsA [PVC group bacterium]|nr:cell division protein FtsA [PVC group bacterium]
MMKSKLPLVSLDIGSAKTTICIGNFDTAGRVEIYNAIMVKTRGMQRGIITNLSEVAEGIEEAVKKAEAKFQASERCRKIWGKRQFRINSAYVTISGEHILGINTKTKLSLSDRPVEITNQDSLRAIEMAKSLSASIDREILHADAQEFIIDGYKKIKEPLGIYGTKLGVTLHLISCGSSFINSLVKAVNQAGLDVDGVVYSGLATSQAILTEEEKEAGVILLEMGAGTTNIMFFVEGRLFYTSTIPMGGYDITLEIARQMKIDFYQAEQLKMQYKSICVYPDGQTEGCDDKIIIKKSSSQYESISRQELAGIIDAKVRELFSMLKKEIESSGIIPRVGYGVVICGGVSFMDGVIEKLERQLNLPIHLGITRGFVSSFSGLGNSFYATGIGLIMHALAEKGKKYKSRNLQRGVVAQLVSKVKNIYEEYF